MGRLKAVLDRNHPCLACGEPWFVRLESRVYDGKFIVWERQGSGRCSADCMTRDMNAYNLGLRERRKRGWMAEPLVRRVRQPVTH
jgi:hypothetical protein